MNKLISSYIISPWVLGIIVGLYGVLDAPDMETAFIVAAGAVVIGYVILILFGTPLLFLCLKNNFVNWYHLSIAGALSAAIPITLIAIYFPLGRGEAATTINNLIVYLPSGLFLGSASGLTYWFLGIYTKKQLRTPND